MINGDQYFRYSKIEMFKLKKFDCFIKMLEEGKVYVELLRRVSRSGVLEGVQRNKNLVF